MYKKRTAFYTSAKDGEMLIPLRNSSSSSYPGSWFNSVH